MENRSDDMLSANFTYHTMPLVAVDDRHRKWSIARMLRRMRPRAAVLPLARRCRRAEQFSERTFVEDYFVARGNDKLEFELNVVGKHSNASKRMDASCRKGSVNVRDLKLHKLPIRKHLSVCRQWQLYSFQFNKGRWRDSTANR